MGIVKHDLSDDLGYYAAKLPRSGRDSMACGPVLGWEDFCGYLEMCVRKAEANATLCRRIAILL
jgi:hypothetical protein